MILVRRHQEQETGRERLSVCLAAVDMWGPIPAVAILLAAAPSGMLSAGFQLAQMGSSRVEYSRTYCVSFTEKGEARPFISKRCMPGTTFKLACNRCLCRQSGNTAICTKKNCYQRLQSSGCEPGSAKTLECNICICSPAGRWACTQRQCRPGVHYVPCDRDMTETAYAGTGPWQCTPGSSFMNGCDRCYCANDGVSAVCRSRPCNGVTGIRVPHGAVSDDSENQSQHFDNGPDQMPGEVEGETFENATHVCYICGSMTVCYEIVDVEGIGEEGGGGGGGGSNLIPGGGALLRTEKPADPTQMPVGVGSGGLTHDSGYQPGHPDFQNETHICFIYEGMATMICIERTTINDISCTPGTTFMHQCNTCWCGPDGKPAACTLMACRPGSY